MATGPLALRTKPSIAPLFHCSCVAFHVWLGWCSSWQVFAMWNAGTDAPFASLQALVGLPSAPSVKPSPRPRTPR